MLTAGRNATFVPADPLSVPADGTLATWALDRAPTTTQTRLKLVLRRNSQVRTTTVRADFLSLTDAVPELAQQPVDADVTPSMAAWAIATKIAVDLVARGRLLPATTAAGVAAWRVGPLDPADHRRLDELAAAMAPEAHALPIPGSRPLRIRSARSLIEAYLDAVADRFVRTAAATAAGGGPFATTTATVVDDGLRAWVASAGAGSADRASPGLRMHLPDGPENDFAAVVQLRSNVDPSLVIDAADLWDAPGPVLDRLGEHADTDLLLALRRGARAWEPVGRLLDQARPETLTLADHEVEELLGPAAESLGAAGLEVLWPSELLSGGIELRAVLGTPSPASVTEAGFTLDRLLEFRWEAAIGGHALTAEEMDELAEAKRPLVRLRGRWVLADPTLLERLRRKPRRLTAADGLAAALAGSLDVGDELVAVVAEGPLADLSERLRAQDERLHELAEPRGLDATLRPYQRRGLAWLAEMTELGLGGCLADDMGLGKTVQLIALHLHRHADGGAEAGAGPTLVVCPASVLGNWQREVNRFAPKVPVRRYHGGERHLDGLADDEIVLATYGLVRRDRDALAEVAWGLVVADEAQHVKNPLSRTARELRSIPSAARVALTGTPVENRLTDLWSILDWTTPGLLGSLDGFRRRVAIPVERHRDPAATDTFARVVRPFLLRRRKLDPGIAPDLPPKTESDEVVPLTAEQATLYEAVVRDALAEIAQTDGMARRGLVLKLLMGLKQICNHPAQYLKQPAPLAARSGKLDALDELLDVILDAGESVLIFTQYVAMARLLERHLRAREVSSLFLHGGTPARRRDEMVDRFQAGEVPVFLLSLKAGGTGLNLTRATQVIHYDRWWNPAVEDQASDRAWRIGQDRPVQVHRLVTEGTVEDRVAILLREKRDLADAVIGTGEAWLAELSDAELTELVSLRDVS
ncbi:MAG: DEAD/DEAH box helicase [Actinobacteria bacterium]|nr:DEAD/DEAH box helicase [Actinomycetota bacterium]